MEQFVERMAQLDVGFYCTHQSYGGQTTVPLSEQQLLSYLQDPVGYLAEYYGVSKQQYLAWHQANYSATCVGKTREGSICKNVVEGGANVTPKRWVELHGSYCYVHQ
jgi:hypothetical protein